MRPSNYDLQAQAAGRSFAAQDLDAIAARFALRCDETYLYLELLHEPLRLPHDARQSGSTAACGCPQASARP